MNDQENKSAIPAEQEQVQEERLVENAEEKLLPPAKFEDLSKPMQAAFQRAGWTEMMQVQAMTIPYMLDRRDLMVQSRTGSGKTGAYLLPMLERLDSSKPNVQALILVPTRELALQVSKEAELLIGDSGMRSVAVYGGVGYGPQLDAFRQGTQVVIGTPGRVLDHLLRRSLSLDNLRILVFDEADRMLSMGFYPDMVRVKSYLPQRRINSYMFSATYPPTVVRLSRQFLRDPEFLNLSSDHVHVTDTEHVYYVVPGMEKDRSLIRVIEIENPTSALIFCNTRARVHYVSVVLQRFGYDADELSADLSQAEREKVLKRVRKGSLRFLVATDVAARGIDIPDLSHVFLYEPPDDQESYIHRAGRTGRAGASGVAISMVNALEKGELQRIGRAYKIDFQERPLPTEEDMQAIVAERAVALLEAELRQRDRLKIERMQRFIPLASSMSESETGSTLLAMLLDDYYQQNFQPPVVAEEPDIPFPQDERGQSEGDRKRSGRKRSGSSRRGGGRKKDN
jgi:ATP-dependent RNA helicase DeaD